MLKLASPSIEYKASFLAGMEELQAEGLHSSLTLAQVADSFAEFVQTQLNEDIPALVLPGRVPQAIWWLVDGQEWLGRIAFRYDLTERLLVYGGHIGYEIRPSQRRKGYGTAALRLVLQQVQTRGHQRVLVMCNTSNQASRRIIETNGGVLEDIRSIPEHPVPYCRYWIEVPRP